MRPRLPRSTLFPYTTLFRSPGAVRHHRLDRDRNPDGARAGPLQVLRPPLGQLPDRGPDGHAGDRDGRLAAVVRSEEHTSELQSLTNLVCRLLLEKKKIIKII